MLVLVLVCGSLKGGGEERTRGRLPTAIGSSQRHEKRGKSGRRRRRAGVVLVLVAAAAAVEVVVVF